MASGRAAAEEPPPRPERVVGLSQYEPGPAGAEIRSREPTVWSRHRWTFAAIGFALAIQTLLIAGLLLERRRRRAAEVRARDNLAVVAHLNRVGAVGELAGSFAHELNSPLGAVLNNAQAARRFIAAGPEHAHEVVACLDDIVGDAGRAGEVIRRMRGIMRHGDVRLVHLDVSTVIRDALRLVEADARDRDVVLSVEIAPSLPQVSGDDVQLVQVVLNLVMNAVDAVKEVPEERRQVRIGAFLRGDRVEIQVADAGAGIPPAQLARVFDPFFTTKPLGLGLGLPISRSIVEAHGGSIEVSPAPGGGAVFHVLLPTIHQWHTGAEAVG
jgi:C4-dicarboxylate-specific signal transduction histidine kinase